jgi:hypothetical protein
MKFGERNVGVVARIDRGMKDEVTENADYDSNDDKDKARS